LRKETEQQQLILQKRESTAVEATTQKPHNSGFNADNAREWRRQDEKKKIKADLHWGGVGNLYNRKANKNKTATTKSAEQQQKTHTHAKKKNQERSQREPCATKHISTYE
jgi:hypothetical protein